MTGEFSRALSSFHRAADRGLQDHSATERDRKDPEGCKPAGEWVVVAAL
jgi:hypothetical protein